MKKLFYIAWGLVALTACSGKDPVYWFEAGSPESSAGSSIPYYPSKPSAGDDTPQGNPTGGYAPAGYKLVWNDEFDSQVKLYSNWYFEKGGTGWGNKELQYYCAGGVYEPTGAQTASVGEGTLKIKAYKITPSKSSDNCGYISARMNTKDCWQHGYIEMRAKLPLVQGTWPAFWMLLQDGPYWVLDPSQTGAEIDIMEYVVNPPDNPLDVVYFSAHSYNATPEGADGKQSGYRDPVTGTKYAYCQWVKVQHPEDWHCYGMEWTHEYIRGLLDGEQYFYVPNPKPNQTDLATWPFDQLFNLKLNLAIGGGWGGTPDPNFTEATYEIDWVRVYQK